MMQSLETANEGTKRILQASGEKVYTGIIKSKTHIGKHPSYVWNKPALEEEVNSAIIY